MRPITKAGLQQIADAVAPAVALRESGSEIYDPQLRVYYEHPDSYARIAARVDLVELLDMRPCAGGQCDGDLARFCRRHELAPAVATRLQRLRARKAGRP